LLFKIAELGGQLGLVIDLTNTDRYYDRADVETLDIAYTKLYCPGHEVNGREDIVKQFIKRVDKFLSDNNDNDMWIGVHCTHGINRTGYLISRYLIDRQEWTSHAALEAFEKARGYPIERGNYVQSLHAAAKNRKSSTKRHSRKSPVVVSEGDDVASEEDSKLSATKRGRRSEQQKTKKHDISTVPNATEMQQMWQMMMKTLAPTTSAAAAGPGNPLNMFNVDNTPKPPIDKPPVKPEEMDDGDEEEDDEEDDGEPEYPVILGDEGDEAGGSKSKKRRVRRKNLQKMFDKMKRGQFWEIQEMQKEKYGLK